MIIIIPSKPTLKVNVRSGSSSTIRILLRDGSTVVLSSILAVPQSSFCKPDWVVWGHEEEDWE